MLTSVNAFPRPALQTARWSLSIDVLTRPVPKGLAESVAKIRRKSERCKKKIRKVKKTTYIELTKTCCTWCTWCTQPGAYRIRLTAADALTADGRMRYAPTGPKCFSARSLLSDGRRLFSDDRRLFSDDRRLRRKIPRLGIFLRSLLSSENSLLSPESRLLSSESRLRAEKHLGPVGAYRIRPSAVRASAAVRAYGYPLQS